MNVNVRMGTEIGSEIDLNQCVDRSQLSLNHSSIYVSTRAMYRQMIVIVEMYPMQMLLKILSGNIL